MALDAEDIAKWLRRRGVLTMSTGSRVRLTLSLWNGDFVETEPKETLEEAFSQLKERVGLREQPRE